MTPSEKRAYSKGYNTGRAGRWPDGVPPIPDDLVRRLAEAAKLARDILDGELAQLFGEPEYESKFGPGIDAVDAALNDITQFALNNLNADG